MEKRMDKQLHDLLIDNDNIDKKQEICLMLQFINQFKIFEESNIEIYKEILINLASKRYFLNDKYILITKR